MNKSVRLPAHIKPERYEIILRPNLQDFTFTGEETIFFTTDKSIKEITLHSVDLEIESMGAKIKYDKASETVSLIFPKPIPKGKDKIKLTFKGILNDKMRGFYRSQYTHEEEVKHLATTQFESTDARRAFPCFDEPAQKSIFDVTLMIPSHMTAISNTVESEVWEHETGIKAVKFESTPKMSAYLLAFIVGEFESVEKKSENGILVRVFTTPGKKEQGRFALDVACKCLDFYEDYFGIKYPLPVLDMIAIPDFAAGAMENWGAVTYRESRLLIDENLSSSANKQWVALVIAHELAHQWFGNLVTMEWWTHLWLNEGFASFIEYLAIDHIFPKWDIWTQFVATEMGDAFALDSLENTHPIEVEVGHPAEISEIFDKVSYAKGASILRMLMSYLGDEDFRKGLKFYLEKYAYSNAKTEDLWASLEAVSGKPVGKIMQNWTSKPGHPVVRVQGISKLAPNDIGVGDRVELTQSRFFSSAVSKKQVKDTTVWSIPLNGCLMDKNTIGIPATGEKLNKGETSLVRIAYPKGYLKDELGPSDRLGIIRDAFDLAQAGETETADALELASTYTAEKDYTVWAEITSQISKVDSLLAYEGFYSDFMSYGQKLYQDIAKRMGWEKKAGESHTDSLLRGMVLYKLGSFGDGETIKKAQELFGKNIDPDLRGIVYNLVAENGEEKEYQQLIQMYKDESNQQEKDRIGRSLGLFKSEKILGKALQFSISKFVRYQNSLQIIASVWTNPRGRYLAWEFVKANWQMLKERYAGGHYFTKVFGPAGEFTKLSDAKDIEKFVKANPTPEAKRTIAQALEQIYSNADWLKRDRENIKKFLEKSEPEGF
ncbi:M1 family metallopeptidase [Candidatus Daviesbacteria bacterium]|nr:M1 family metallopeptidase [Candidatus Daviesbacteria bacterium]